MPKVFDKKKEKSDDTPFNFKINKEVLAKLKELADQEDRTVASIIRIAISEYLKGVGK